MSLKKSMILFGIGAVVLGVFLYFLRGTGFIQVLENANYLYFGAAFLLNFLMIFFWTKRWDIVLKSMGHRLKFFWLYVATMLGNFGDTITPGARMGGEPFRAYVVEEKQPGVKLDDLASSLLMEASYNSITFSVIAILSIVFILFKYTVPGNVRLLLIGMATIGSAGICFIFYFMFRTAKGARVLEKIVDLMLKLFEKTHMAKYFKKKHFALQGMEKKWDKHIESVFFGLRRLSTNAQLWRKGMVLCALYWLTIYAQAYLCFLAVGGKIPFVSVVAIVAISDLAGTLTLLPSGIGVVEVVQTSLAYLFGLSIAQAGAAIVLLRGSYYVFGIILGYIVLLIVTEGEGHKAIHKHIK